MHQTEGLKWGYKEERGTEARGGEQGPSPMEDTSLLRRNCMGSLLSVLHTVLPTSVPDLGGAGRGGVSDLHVHTSPSTHLGDNDSYCMCLLG